MWFSPDARWWPSWIGYLAGAVIVQFAWSMWRTRNGHRDFRSNYLPVLFTPWFLLIGATLYALGARDLLDFKDFLAGQSLTSKIGYYNVHRHTWSEWGALGIWARHKVDGLHSESAVKQYLTTGGQVVVPGRQHLDKLQADLGYVPLKIEEWKRWKIHGAVKGDTSLLDALRSRDVAPLQDRYFIVALKPTTRQQVNN